MVTVSNFQYLLWFSCPVLEASVLVLLLRNGLRKKFPLFLQFILFQLIQDVGLYFVHAWGSPATYFYAYWATSGVSFVLAFMVVREIFEDVFRPYEALRDFAGILFRWATLVLLLVAAVLAFSASSREDWIVVAVLSIERSVMVMLAGILLFFMLTSSKLGVSWKQHSFGIALGFGLYSCAQMIINTLRSQFGVDFSNTYAVCQSLSFAFMLCIWAVYLASPEPARVAVANAFAPKPVLERWNQGLRGPDLAPQSAFLMNLERIVDQVMDDQR